MSLNGHRPQVRIHESGDIKLPPHNIDIERAVLGTVIAHPEHLPLVASVLDVEDFYRDSHQVLFRTILELRAHGIPIEAITVDEELTRTDRLAAVGGRGAFLEILCRAGTGGPLVHYVKELRDKGSARQLLLASEDLARAVYAGGRSADLATEYGRRLAAIGASGTSDADAVSDRWPRPDPRVYHGVVGQIVLRAAPHTEADPIAILVQLLIAFGNLIGPSPYYLVGPSKHRLNLFACLVGPTSSGRKGTSWDIVLWLLGAFDEDWIDSCIRGGLTSGEGLIYHVRDDAEAPIDRRLLIVETEFARSLKAAAREQNTLSDVIRQAWDSGNLRTLSKNQPVQATGAHVSLIAHITQADLKRHLGPTDSLNGFANRFLWVAARRSQLLPHGDTLHRIDWSDVHRHLAQVIPWAREQGRIECDAAAHAAWPEHYRRLTGRVGPCAGILGRAEPLTLRLACLYALLDGAAAIRPEHLDAAEALWNYAESSARMVFGDSLGDPAAERLLAALKAAPQGLSRWEITTDVFGGHKHRDEITAVLGDLLTQGLISRDRRPTRGRPLEIWRLGGSEESEVSEESPPETVIGGSEESEVSEESPSEDSP
jgi:hypothetical protein